jgi:hypothetical protein
VYSRLLFRWMSTILAVSLCPLVTGCLGIGWAYPTASFIPSVAVGTAAQDVRAFRIDVKNDTGHLQGAGIESNSPSENDRYVMSEMTGRFGDRLIPQGKLAVDYGCTGLDSPGANIQQTSHTLLVRLYRSGFKTVEITSWQFDANPVWHEAPTLQAREKAVDDLVSTFVRDAQAHEVPGTKYDTKDGGRGNDSPRDSAVFARMAPGSASSGHRAALLFAASEYELLAHGGTEGADRDFAARVSAKSTALRKLAAE